MRVESLNPHDQSVVGTYEATDSGRVAAAVATARIGQPAWRDTPLGERVAIISRYRDAIEAQKDEIARLITLEMGKPLAQSLDEVAMELDFLDYYIEQAPSVFADEVVREDAAGTYCVVHEPYGVIACVAPWNFPLAMTNSGLIPALLAGNTCVFKPSEHTTLSQNLAVSMLRESGVPSDVLQLVNGAGGVGAALVDADVDLVWFTGSTATGREIYRKCAERFLPALLELGGSSPGLVFADANLENTVENIYWARFLANGQVCNAIKRLYVERTFFDQFVEAFVARVDALSVGDPLTGVDIGPLVSPGQTEKLQDQLDDALTKGARVVTHHREVPGGGNYFAPVVLTGVTTDMCVMTEETFGPLLPVIPFDTEAEAVEMANDTPYGLSAEVYSSDAERCERIARQLQAGNVGINTFDYIKPELPFGGYKASGLGREYGRAGMQEFTRKKSVAIAR